MPYWQVAAGSYGRDYSDRFIRHGIAFVGEGSARRMGLAQVGDVVVLKNGITSIRAVGRVVARDGRHSGVAENDPTKEWLLDLDGWQLPAWCYVDWRRPDTERNVAGLTMGSFVGVNNPAVQQAADEMLQAAPLGLVEPEPGPTKHLDDEAILRALVRDGLRPGAAQDLVLAFHRIRLLARYYYDEQNWDDIREHETRTFLIIPLLSALGWAEQRLKIELPVCGWSGAAGRVDIAGFRRPYRRNAESTPNDEDCTVIVETKGFPQGLSYAPDQAIAYAKAFPNCDTITVSNGYCYKTFARRDDGTFDTATPSAYLNILAPRDRYPLDPENVAGGADVLRHLLA